MAGTTTWTRAAHCTLLSISAPTLQTESLADTPELSRTASNDFDHCLIRRGETLSGGIRYVVGVADHAMVPKHRPTDRLMNR